MQSDETYHRFCKEDGGYDYVQLFTILILKKVVPLFLKNIFDLLSYNRFTMYLKHCHSSLYVPEAYRKKFQMKLLPFLILGKDSNMIRYISLIMMVND